jgi:hypothetical protein
MIPQIKLQKMSASVATTLKTLLGRAVTVTVGKPAPIAPACVVGHFIRDDGSLDSVIVAPIALASYLGASLALIPPAVATAAGKAPKLDDNLGENYAEVMNVLTNILIEHAGAHLKFVTIAMRAATSTEIQALVAKPKERADFEVNVTGYGQGPLTFLFNHAA